ncbi:MAG: hypothetical protein A3C93_02530 [Candidatus Lloydbacteria bacterium RIFCSPHIGHO2_02_FULL_54_17]|uniref:Uncharacterized protein n=1 Tax=Candidatus Lloydbacteria bacterium RIFCSPHIGHO2_02_FULL_54_17 TaxID=1798664 RepID=A0A1G2DDX2_9BACT|nr:MAG: hypothetical protein A2762_04370 [Candidatus Lloydbacteria bacterium RIFCSPHIGHO2_01_FULL_54_11]OGZ11786.1 MAG: hypothetical protein A3C93_02530 [Candidatus Lloydbacteria bacterium RIFCSPHIGHO2_02_FULL_54_17]OGZ14315.1 MAG: hypothetical protein A2948_01865 [Candidatus Lloydbacteria bacterium RIFCSPLOWO2_01_FULL_54_18]OGZ16017.1 MAG: hypothetical protein A3H76_00615 [Candidatus Lloydbacteria bacterium RIFCSPLOWO2_02_FULL_54_12]
MPENKKSQDINSALIKTGDATEALTRVSSLISLTNMLSMNIIKKGIINRNNINNMNEFFKQIENHLGFFGYKSEIGEKEGEKVKNMMFRHPTKLDYFVTEFIPGIFLFSTSIGYDRRPNDAMDSAINTANRKLNLTRAYYDTKDDKEKGRDKFVILRLEAGFTGKYEKNLFGVFFGNLERDQRVIFENGDFIKAFNKEETE